MTKYLNAGAILGTTPVDLFVCPENHQSIVHSLFVSTISDTEPCEVTIQVFDASQGRTYTVGNKIRVLPNKTLSFDKQINLESNDILKVFSQSVDEVHVFASIMTVLPASL